MAGKSVVVAGAGGNIGSHLVRGLARMVEVRRVVLIDRDTYEERNLVNQDILPRDIGQPKVMVQARRLAGIRPDLEVNAWHAPLESLPLETWRADLILACLDSRAARQVVNERAWRVGVPWIDSGVMGSECLARVNVYAPGAGANCLECAWGDDEYRLIEQHYACAGPAGAAFPNTATSELGSLAAALLAIECRKMLGGETDRAAVGKQVTLNARWHQFAVTAFRRNPRCRFDHAVWSIEPLAGDMRGMTIADLLTMAPAVRVPGQRFVQRLVCASCRNEKRLFQLDASIGTDERRCGRCERPMTATGFDIVESLDGSLPAEVLRLTLNQAGLRAGDVIHDGDRYFSLHLGQAAGVPTPAECLHQ